MAEFLTTSNLSDRKIIPIFDARVRPFLIKPHFCYRSVLYETRNRKWVYYFSVMKQKYLRKMFAVCTKREFMKQAQIIYFVKNIFITNVFILKIIILSICGTDNCHLSQVSIKKIS